MTARVLIGCETSGIFRRAFLAAGFDAWSCDLLPAEDGSNRHFVLGHPRRLPGKTIYIPGHWKGCQSLGVVLHRYVSEGGEMKRLPDDGTLGKMTAREALAIVRPDVILPASLTGEPQ